MAHIRQKCDFCDNPAVYDCKTIYGPWGFCCEQHFQNIGVKTPGLFKRLEPEVVQKKKCSHCGRELPITDFYSYVDARGVRRFRTECKVCNSGIRKKRRMYNT